MTILRELANIFGAGYGNSRSGYSKDLDSPRVRGFSRFFAEYRSARLLPFLNGIFNELRLQTNRTPPYIR